MAPSEWTAEEFERIADSWPNRLVLESAALDVYGQLTDGPLSATQLAERLGLEPRAARLFFDALAALELLHKEEDRYSNSEAARRYLVEASPEYLGHSLIAGLDSWDLWSRLPDALRTGERQRRGDIFSEEPEAARHLLLAIHRRALTHAAALLERGMVEPLGHGHMLDLGGGAGTYSIAFCRQNPELRSTLLDLPTAVALARELVAASGLEDRIQASECDFEKDDIRVGTIVAAEDFPEALKPAFKLQVDFGDEIGVRKSSAQITRHYTAAALIGRQVAAVVNFEPKQIGPLMSEVLVLGFPDADGEICLISVDPSAPNGGKFF